MKKLFSVLAISAVLASCHYGREEAQKTLNANEQYKTDRKDYSVNRANAEPGSINAPADSAKADTAQH